MDKYPGYASWAAELAARDNGFTFIVVVAAIILLWMFYSRTIFKRLENISRPVVITVLYVSIIGMQLMLGGGSK